MTSHALEPVTGGRLTPATSRDTEFFWAGARGHKLLIQRCSNCFTFRHPPGPACPQCHSLDWEPREVSGKGVLYSYVVYYAPVIPGFQTPITVAIIQLDEGVRLISNVVDVDPDDLHIGDRVEVLFADQEEGWTVPQFHPSVT